MSRSTLFALVLAVVAPLASAQIDETPWHLEVEWELGSEDSGVYFSFPFDLVIGNDDQIYLSDRREPGITVFTRSGEEVMTIGQEGQGPGEFSEVTSMLAMPEGGVMVHDRRGGRLSQFDAQGTLMRTIVIPDATPRLLWLAAYHAASDRLAFVKETVDLDVESPLLYWADLSSETLGEGVLMPSDYIDLEDPVFAFAGRGPLAHNAVALNNDNGSLLVYPTYYTGSWAMVDFKNGELQNPRSFAPDPEYALKHATKLDITEEEWRATRDQYGMVLGSYGRNGVHFADIHNFTSASIVVGSDHHGIVFTSEESGMDGQWIDVFESSGSLVGRQPLLHELNTLEGGNPMILASNGMDEVYFLYYTPDMVPIIGRGRLVPQD